MELFDIIEFPARLDAC